jgi:hypothetical protein
MAVENSAKNVCATNVEGDFIGEKTRREPGD